MPREIADSDAESDFNSPRRPSISPIHNNIVYTQPQSTYDNDPFANLEFDKFLSPTQRLSSALERLDADQRRLASSTDNFLRDIAQGDPEITSSITNPHGLDGSIEQSFTLPPRQKLKRTFSDIEGGQTKSKYDSDVAQRSAKRTKTYGSSRSFITDGSPLFSDTLEVQQYDKQEVSNDSVQSRSETTSNELPIQQLMCLENTTNSEPGYPIHHRGYNHTHPQQVHTTFLQGNIQNASLSKSSVGGYSSINLDFRGAGVGLDINANPFGSLSQVSLDGDVELSQSEGFADFFRHNRRISDGDGESGCVELNITESLQRGHLKEMATSPAENLDSDRKILSKSIGNIDDNPKTQIAPVAPTASEAKSKSSEKTTSDKPPPKKRGRKPKNVSADINNSTHPVNVFERLQSEDPLNIPEEQYKPRPSRSRASTVDSVDSHLSQITQDTHSTSRKRKRSAIPKPTTEAIDQHLSSELNLSDPAMIGVPKEMYVPRPSKSRQKRKEVEDDINEARHEERNVGADVSDVIDNNAQSQPRVEIADPTHIPGTKKKSSKKSKVKRAKTSAAAILQSAAMYDEDDKDCFIVDEMPVKVKMASLPVIKPVKPEPEDNPDHNQQKAEEADDAAVSNSKESENSAEVKLSVDIPKLTPGEHSEVPAQLPEPKKRGRKPKKKPEILVEEESNVDDQKQTDVPNDATPHPDLNPTKSRPALTSKDPNTTPTPPSPAPTKALDPPTDQATKTPSPSPKKPVHSPLKPTLISSSGTSTSRSWIKPRIGLSKRTSIPSLLRKLDRSKEPPKVHERKEKLSKRQLEEEERRRLEAEDAGEEYVDKWEMRGKDGMLVEWDE